MLLYRYSINDETDEQLTEQQQSVSVFTEKNIWGGDYVS